MKHMNRTETLKTVSGIILGIVGITICVGFFFVSDREKQRRQFVDRNSLCPTTTQPVNVWGWHKIHPPEIPRHVAVVVDATDNIPSRQREEIVNWFRAVFVDSLMPFEKVRIYQLDEIVSDEAPKFEKCAPPAKANHWIENPRVVRKEFEGKFLHKLVGVVESLASRSERRYSPLMEMVGHMFKSHDKVILVSDLMHNVSEYSLYDSRQKRHMYDDFLRTPYAGVLTRNMQEKKLEVVYLIRQKLKPWQNETLGDFWRTHMERNGGQMKIAQTLSTID